MKAEDSIMLDPERGLNPGLTCCPRCGGEGNEIALVGLAKLWKCGRCGAVHVEQGKRPPRKCQKCGHGLFSFVEDFDGWKHKVAGSEPCGRCKKELAKFIEIVKAGGVFWRCKDCGAEGVIRAGEFAELVRKKTEIEAPELCGVEFDKNDCPSCGPLKESYQVERLGEEGE